MNVRVKEDAGKSPVYETVSISMFHYETQNEIAGANSDRTS
jgi:hypothetical protein